MSKLLILAATPHRKDPTLSTFEIATAGAISAIPTTLIAAPVERAKVLLQVQGQEGRLTQYKGVIDVLKHLYKEGGIRSVFRGSVATGIRDGPGSAAFVTIFLIHLIVRI
jgi:solute carrier family 25 (mitochondrial carnitine/acylcarnitine transporter), member 20/29